MPDIGGVLGAITCKMELSATSVWSAEDGVLLCISLDSPSLVVFSDALALFISAVFCVASLLVDLLVLLVVLVALVAVVDLLLQSIHKKMGPGSGELPYLAKY